MRSLRRPLRTASVALVAIAAAVLPSAPAQAQQFTGTGIGATSGLDPNGWSVAYYRMLSGSQGYGIADFGIAPAVVVPSIPSPWQPTPSAAGAHWIGVNGGASLGNAPGDNALRVGYLFFQRIGATATGMSYAFDLGWDNRLSGAYFLPGQLTDYASLAAAADAFSQVLDPAAFGIAPSAFGFCRDGDGILPTSASPNCTTRLQMALPTSSSGGYVAFHLVGDGQTDGLYIGNVAAAPQVVPESGTVALIATGLAGVGAVAWRRRRTGR